jgi:uncharacterized LabA/DUF88 family protein
MNRYCFYVDGFNVYHALNDFFNYKPGLPRKPGNMVFPYRKYKWLNYRQLAESVILSKDTITGVFYFTTYAMWKWNKDPGIRIRHTQYIKALRTQQIDVIQGRFKWKEKRCPLCKGKYETHVEKRTDVNIALKVVGDAIENLYDRAVIVSADSDLLPVVAAIHRYAPTKEVGFMFPIRGANVELRQAADFRFRMNEKLLARSQFPDSFEVSGKTFERPQSWR